jgi:hypothetical protein
MEDIKAQQIFSGVYSKEIKDDKSFEKAKQIRISCKTEGRRPNRDCKMDKTVTIGAKVATDMPM